MVCVSAASEVAVAIERQWSMGKKKPGLVLVEPAVSVAFKLSGWRCSSDRKCSESKAARTGEYGQYDKRLLLRAGLK